MDNPHYIVAISLIENSDKRAMPFGGKSLTLKEDQEIFPENKAKIVSLELLFRVLEKCETQNFRRILTNHSLFVIKISFDLMRSKLPILKNKWIETNETDVFINELKDISTIVKSINFSKYDGIMFKEV